MVTATTAPPDALIEGTGQVLQAYFDGVYSEARRRAEELQRNSASLDTWGAAIAKALHDWLTEWDALSAVRPLIEYRNATASPSPKEPWEQVRRFYAGLFAALICCSQARNFSALRLVEDVASATLRDFGPDLWPPSGTLQEFRDLLAHTHFPPPWAALWFRAIARGSLGQTTAAREDWELAYNHAVDAAMSHKSSVFPKLEGRYSQAYALQYLRLGGELSPIVVRFLHDLGEFCFKRGDWGWDPEARRETFADGYGAKAFFDAAKAIAESTSSPNPYVLTGRAEFYSYARREDEAVRDIAKAYAIVETYRDADAIGSTGFYSSGRMYFQAGLLAHKYRLRQQLACTPADTASGTGRLAAFEAAVESIEDMELKELVKDQSGAGACELFQRSAKCYFGIKDPFLAIPALIMMADPSRDSGDESVRAARSLLWEFLYGFGTDFISELINYENLVAQYFIADPAK
jgi:hypothetical protein